MRPRVVLLLLLAVNLTAANAAPLELESEIALGDIHGRIDHLAVDLGRQRLFVAELGNDTVAVVDLKARKVIQTLVGLKEPQGLGYVPSTDTLYVANANDGSVRLFQGVDLASIGKIALGRDADNVRVDDAAHRVYVGYGDGALAVIDTVSRRTIANIALHAHPESFQLDRSGQRIFVNIPDSHEIAALDRATDSVNAIWSTQDLSGNFPLALDEAHQRIISVFRHPAKVGVFRMSDGQRLSTADTCGDADDAFLDEKRNRLYVSCGEGVIEVLAAQNDGYVSIGRVATAGGARTGFFISTLDRFVLAARGTGTAAPAVRVFRPVD